MDPNEPSSSKLEKADDGNTEEQLKKPKTPRKSAGANSSACQTPFALLRRRRPSRFNKLYRCPPTPPPEVLYNLERSFILDSRAVSQISNDYSNANPKLGSVIPPYNAQVDHHADNYFKFFGIRKILAKSGQATKHESIAGHVYDRFHQHGHGFRYLSLRNKSGSGHSVEEIRGHELFLADPKPVLNYNGVFGFRRNTPSTRQRPTIGVAKIDTNGYAPLGRYSAVGCGRSYSFHCECKFDEPCRCHNQNKLCPCTIKP